MMEMEIHHIAISVTDMAKSISFYRENFGFDEIRRYTKEGWNGEAAILKLKDTELEIFSFKNHIQNKDDSSKFEVLGLKHIAFLVPSVEDKYKELKAKGVNISEPKKGTTCTAYCFLTDPDGITLELYQK